MRGQSAPIVLAVVIAMVGGVRGADGQAARRELFAFGEGVEPMSAPVVVPVVGNPVRPHVLVSEVDTVDADDIVEDEVVEERGVNSVLRLVSMTSRLWRGGVRATAVKMSAAAQNARLRGEFVADTLEFVITNSGTDTSRVARLTVSQVRDTNVAHRIRVSVPRVAPGGRVTVRVPVGVVEKPEECFRGVLEEVEE